MATILEGDGHAVTIKDYPINKGSIYDYERDLAAFLPDVLVINATIPSLTADVACAKTAKERLPGITVVLRCGMIDHIAREVLQREKALDIIIYGESDHVVKELLNAGTRDSVKGIYFRDKGTVVRTEERPLLDDLDTLPIINRDLIDNRAYIRPDTGAPLGLIEVSRGCPYSCIFCLTPATFGRKHRRRSVERIVQEIKICVERYGILDFHLKSDLFTAHHEWVRQLCDVIRAARLNIRWFANSRVDSVNEDILRSMKESGCFAVSFGVESGSQAILDKMHKKITVADIMAAFAACKKNGIETYAYFIMGFPWDTRATIGESVQLCKKIDPDYVDFFFPYVFYGTELYDICREMKLVGDITYAEMQKRSYVTVAFPTLTVSQEELLTLRRNALRAFYLRPRYVIKMFRRCKNMGEFLRLIRSGVMALIKLVK
jgi:anaerobic magnesium-protoporphyrin IX monomethyl ester cyclase